MDRKIKAELIIIFLAYVDLFNTTVYPLIERIPGIF